MPDRPDPDDAPGRTARIAARGELRTGRELPLPATAPPARPGRPPTGAQPKRQVTLRLDPDVIEAFRASGPGWQSRINAALRKAAGLG